MATTTVTEVSPDWVRMNRRMWSVLFIGQILFTLAMLVTLAADWMPIRVRLTPQLVGLDTMVLAMGIALLVLHRRHPDFSGNPAEDRTRYERNILYPLSMLAAASVFGVVIMLLTGCIWPGALVPMVSLAAQLMVWPPQRVGEL